MWRIFGSSSSAGGGGSGAGSATNASGLGENVFARDAALVDDGDGDDEKWVSEALAPNPPRPLLPPSRGSTAGSGAGANSPQRSLAALPASSTPLAAPRSASAPSIPLNPNMGTSNGLVGASTPSNGNGPAPPPRTELGDPLPGFPAAPKAARFAKTTKLEPSNWAVSGPPPSTGTPGTAVIGNSSSSMVPGPDFALSGPSTNQVLLTAPNEKTVFDLAGLSGPSSDENGMAPASPSSPYPLGSASASGSFSFSQNGSFTSINGTQSNSLLPTPLKTSNSNNNNLLGGTQSEDPLSLFASPAPKVVHREMRPPAMEALLNALEDHDWGMDVVEESPVDGKPKRRPQTKSEVLRSLQDTLTVEDKVSYLRLVRLVARLSRHHPTHPAMPPSNLSKSSLRKVLKTASHARTRYALYVQRTEEKLALYLDLPEAERERAEMGGRVEVVAGELKKRSGRGNVEEKMEVGDQDEEGNEKERREETSDKEPVVEAALEPVAERAWDPAAESVNPEPETNEITPPTDAEEQPTTDALKPETTKSPTTPQTASTDPRHSILSHFFLLSVADGLGYPPYARTLLRQLAVYLDLDAYDVVRIEAGLSAQLGIFVGEDEEVKLDGEADRIIRDRERRERVKRWAVTALAFAGGGALIGLSAGVMAPLIGAGVSATLGMVGVGGTAGFLGSATGAAVIAAGGAVTGGTISAKKMAKRTGRLGTFELLPVRPAYVAPEDDYMPLPYPSVTICVSGWLTEGESDFHAPWSTVSPGALGELHTLRWDPSDLANLGSAFRIIAGEVISFGVQQVLGATVLHALMLGLTLPMWVAKLGYALDNPWGIGLSKAKKAGLVLADSIVAQVQGHRPVTLVGFSLGARVIFYCLLELAQRGHTELVEDAFLVGAPVMATETEWAQCCSAVSGRVVNGYLPGDWVLGLLYRASTATYSKVAGLHSVEGVAGLENVDLTGICEGHLKYRVRMPRILEKFGIKVWREWFDEEDEEERRQEEEAKREGRVIEQAPPPVPVSAAKPAGKSDLWSWADIMELKRIQDQMEDYFEPKDLGASSLPPLVITKDMLENGDFEGASSSGVAGESSGNKQEEPDRSGMRLEMDELSDDEEDEGKSTTTSADDRERREPTTPLDTPASSVASAGLAKERELERLEEEEAEDGMAEVDLGAGGGDESVVAAAQDLVYVEAPEISVSVVHEDMVDKKRQDDVKDVEEGRVKDKVDEAGQGEIDLN